MRPIYNFHQVNDRLACSGQPTEEQLQAIMEEGYKVIINLGLTGTKYSLPDEAASVAGLGLTYHHIPVQFDSPQIQELEDFLYQQGAPPLAILVPSYKEDVQVIKQTLLSAALQEYPHRRVVLLIDDPPSPGNWEDSMKLIKARNAPYQIQMLLSEQDKRLRGAWQSFATRLRQGCLDRSTEMARLAALYQEVAQWFKRQAETYPIRNHTDNFLYNRFSFSLFTNSGSKRKNYKIRNSCSHQLRLIKNIDAWLRSFTLNSAVLSEKNIAIFPMSQIKP
ncbi:MAG: hypothetical protein ACXVIY_13525 [Mucilaginibacter sp.]